MSNTKSKVANALIGIAGVHFVVSELSLRGLIALPTIRNTAGIDVIVSSPDGSWHANLQVKTSQRKVASWPVGKRYDQWRVKDSYYIFVRFLQNESRFEAFLESADIVAQQVQAYMQTQVRKDWPFWPLPKDDEERERVHRQWCEFGQGHSA